VAEWGAQSAKKCYIVTRETVRFGSTPGLDPQSGRECRPFNAALLERLREYEKGNRPKLVTASDPTFFDLRTGEPNLWYSKSDSNGRIKLFDLIGFDPETGQELLPVTPQIAAAWKKQIDAVARRPPQKVDPEKYAFFDTVTGEPRVWYWRGGYAEWEFYDNAGFRSTGEKLTLISQPLIDQWRRENAEKRRQAAEQAAKTEKERLAAQEAERKRREEEDARQLALQQSGENCDRAAANPTDSKRPASVAGVEYNDLKSHAKEAAEACDRAAKMHPAEARYRYNRARALEFINPQQAINLHVSLTKEGYAAAHDNLGGLFWKERKDLQGAIKEYEAGVKLGDPSAMVSLAWLIKNNLYSIADPVSARFALLTKAAQAGHKTAQDMLSKEQQELQLRAYQQQNQQMQQQMMFNMFNTVLRNMAH
jgi:hypothetical protein